MATHVGKEGSAAVGVNDIVELNGWSLAITANVEATEDTALGDEWLTYKSGSDVEKSWSGTLSCMLDETDSTGQQTMVSGAEVTLNLYTEGQVAGDQIFTGQAIIQEITIDVARNQITPRVFNFLGTGALTESTV